MSCAVFACVRPESETFGQVAVSQVVGIYDGDSITVTIDAWPGVIGQAIGVRVAGIDTPEIRAQCPQEKKRALAARLFTRRAVTQANSVTLMNIKRDKYFRLLADVCVDDRSLGALLVAQGLAVRYQGGKKISWCP
ncbi:thermonuclease family protein [Halioxenophilus aromaticivorans]|uniref:TNase-like domain-containing protein n=1 Tax=Halioxenophilus aromaticivorans TaxID=1306992 RepID=A0AAV3U4D6_9ALTE